MPLISAAQLDTWRHSDRPPCILDASWHLPSTGRVAREEFLTAHIPGARFFDISLFTEPASPLPETLATDSTTVAPAFAALGIQDGQAIVFYDRSALHTACRAYWICRLWGVLPERLFILDGGFDNYNKQGFITASGTSPPPTPNALAIAFKPNRLKTLTQIKHHLSDPQAQIIDCRHPVRFAGGPETRPGLRLGHIPGSFCFPWFVFFNAEGRFLPFEKIFQRLKDIGIDVRIPIITTCGSGITATILNFVLDCLAYPDHALYDGAWAEWGSNAPLAGEAAGVAERPIETCLSAPR